MSESKADKSHVFDELTEDFIQRREARYYRREGIPRTQAIEELGTAAVGRKEWQWVIHPDINDVEITESTTLHAEDVSGPEWDKPFVALSDD